MKIPQFSIHQVLTEGTRGESHTTPDGTVVILYKLGMYDVLVWSKGQTAVISGIKVGYRENANGSITLGGK